jgi:hypothetical protein
VPRTRRSSETETNLVRKETVECLGSDGLERVSAVGFARPEFVAYGEVGGEGGRGGAGGSSEGVGGDRDGGGHEEGCKAEFCTGSWGVGGLGTWEGGSTRGLVCFEVVLRTEFLCGGGGVNNGNNMQRGRGRTSKLWSVTLIKYQISCPSNAIEVEVNVHMALRNHWWRAHTHAHPQGNLDMRRNTQCVSTHVKMITDGRKSLCRTAAFTGIAPRVIRRHPTLLARINKHTN